MKTKRAFEIGKHAVTNLVRRIHGPGAATLSMVAAVVAFTAFAPAFAGTTAADLENLEKYFFHRTYTKDTQDARLDRLEKMVFGEAKEGAEQERLSNLLKLVPEEEAVQTAGGTAGGGERPRSPAASAPRGSQEKASAPAAPEPREDEGTKYPAVSAIERKLFGREFEGEPVETRLTRLEKKAFGKASSSTDLSERTDALKAQTGVDIARRPPSGADWNDEDDEGDGDGSMDYPDPAPTSRRNYPGVPMSDSGRSFSGRDVGSDLNKAFGRSSGSGTGYGGSGSYGMGGYSSSSSGGSSGSYGFGGGYGANTSSRFPGSQSRPAPSSQNDGGDSRVGNASLPPKAPPRGNMPPVAPPRTGASTSSGLTAQLDSLETQVFGKTYQEPLIQRLDRLETTVFPHDKSARTRTPQERVARLANVLSDNPQTRTAQSPSAPPDQDFEGEVGMDSSGASQPQIAQQGQRNRGGLGKIINSLGNFLSGGMAVGSYPMGANNLVTDPATGMLLDQYSGNLINPTTGQVVGRKAGYANPGMVPGYGMNTFNNGFSPYYSPYSNPYSNPYGVGGGGIRFGTGGIGVGGLRFGGGSMWP